MTGGEHLARFRTLLATRMGWTFADADLPHLGQELAARAAARGLDAGAYLDRLGAGGWREEISTIAEDLTITETYFFRHGEQFRALADTVLPERIAARAERRALRLLSVGSSSGEEAYTLAIIARTAAPGPDWIVSVLGLDANPAMLRKAAGACYSGWSLRETPDEVRQRWFRPRDGGHEVLPEIRELVRFRQYNVADEDAALWRPDLYDVIFCRNLLMYLTPATAAALVRRMTRALAPGGYLFLGHTDSLGSRPDGLEPQHDHGTFYYRRPPAAPAAGPAPAAPRRDPAPGPPAAPPAAAADRIRALLHAERFADALDLAEAALTDHPARPDLLLYGVLLAQAGRLDDAEITARRLLDRDGLDADAHHLLAVCLEGGAAVDVAIGHYRLAAYLDPAFAMPRVRLGLLARRRGDHRTALTELDRAVDLLRGESDDRLAMFGGGFGRIALSHLCRTEIDACGSRR
ncbi:CheR family methyltransferase [Jidongwangia harbinensis]|uniref:CheR family methyltransferase n=1 Tax=Jidongwangia harbinensis TaxID=2878561 RepID=UPI001CD96495|nr:CheR family methyltransferase [Jidongwangia harbinensis]MCA2212083.1 tetratricopeptide repeat protein [Jidongwangia harbinensis]